MADALEGILMCCPLPRPYGQLLALQRGRTLGHGWVFWDGSWVFWCRSQATVQDPGGTTSSLFTPRHEWCRAEPVPPISCGAVVTVVQRGFCPQNHRRHLPSPLSPQGRARRTVHPVPPRPLHPTGAVSPPAVRASTLPTATGCPTKSARGTLPPQL